MESDPNGYSIVTVPIAQVIFAALYVQGSKCGAHAMQIIPHVLLAAEMPSEANLWAIGQGTARLENVLWNVE